MDYAKLKALIAATPECSGKTAQEIADLLNAKTITTYDRIEPPSVMMWMIPNGRRQKLDEAAVKAALDGALAGSLIDQATHVALANFAWGLRTMINVPNSYVDYNLPSQQQAAGAFVALGIMTQGDVDDLVNPVKRLMSLAEQAELGAVTESDVLNCSTF